MVDSPAASPSCTVLWPPHDAVLFLLPGLPSLTHFSCLSLMAWLRSHLTRSSWMHLSKLVLSVSPLQQHFTVSPHIHRYPNRMSVFPPFDCELPEARGHPPGLQPQCSAQYLEQRRSNRKMYKLLLLKPGSSSIPWPQPETQSHPRYFRLPQNLHPIHQEPSVPAPNIYFLNIHISFPLSLPPPAVPSSLWTTVTVP